MSLLEPNKNVQRNNLKVLFYFNELSYYIHTSSCYKHVHRSIATTTPTPTVATATMSTILKKLLKMNLFDFDSRG